MSRHTPMLARLARLRPIPCMLAALLLSGCAPSDPPTVTPDPSASRDGAIPGRSSVVEMTMPAPPAREAMPVSLDLLEPYVDETGLFTIDLPVGWLEQRQDPSGASSDVRLGTLFQAPEGDGLLSITQFDNGRPPSSLGTTVNTVLRDVTGWMDQPGYTELDRESVVERPGEAMRVEIVYERSNGVPMHALALFQIDGTTFSMVNLSVAEGSFRSNESKIREVLRSYRVPLGGVASPQTTTGTAGEGEEEGHTDGDGTTNMESGERDGRSEGEGDGESSGSGGGETGGEGDGSAGQDGP